jgi:hypothetical protein
MLNGKGYMVFDDDIEYKYLTKMTMDSVTEENVAKQFNEHKIKSSELEITKNTTSNQMWLNELSILEEEYKSYKLDRERTTAGITSSKKKVIIKKKV